MATPTTQDMYSTNVLIQTVPNLLLSQNWLLNRFFPNVITYDTEWVSIDVDVGKRRIAPFVSPLVQGKLVESRRIQTNTYKPPYIKDKRAPDVRKPIRRQIGERIGGGEMSMAEKEMINLQFEMVDQIDNINRRMEWMAANALVSGKITVTGEGFDNAVIDFARSPSLTIALTGSNKWPLSTPAGTDNFLPSESIEQWQQQILQSSGAVATDLIFTNSSWRAFTRDTLIKQSGIIMPALNPYGNQMDAGPRIVTGAIHKGMWGQYNLWLYNDWYVDPVDEIEKPMIPDGAVIMTGGALEGVRAFGAIIDPAFNYGPMAYAPKSWLQEDPAQRMLMMQSAPLVIPSRVNASLCAMVV